MIEILKYSTELKADWDKLIASARNGSFLFYRNYMDYHSDRFVDCSFLFLKDKKIEAVIPGNVKNQIYYSHQGLTYGGLISSTKIYTKDVLDIFDLLISELLKIGIREVIYKPIPQIYHRIPSQEDIYALFLKKAIKIECNISSTLLSSNRLRFSESRRSGLRKSIREGVTMCLSENFQPFWEILSYNLFSKYNKKPVHNLQEIELLRNRFPDNIKLYEARLDNEILGGTVLYLNENVVHVQYISASDKGKNIGALDYIFDKLINNIYHTFPIFDFGQSTEESGYYLNQNLIFQKEGFGGRGIVYDTYKFLIQ